MSNVKQRSEGQWKADARSRLTSNRPNINLRLGT